MAFIFVMKDVDFHSVWTLSAGMASTNFCRLWPAKMDFRLMRFPQEALLCSERRMPSATLSHTPFQSTFLKSRFSSLIFLNKYEKPFFVPNSFPQVIPLFPKLDSTRLPTDGRLGLGNSLNIRPRTSHVHAL